MHFISSDNDGHWYVIPVERKAEWSAWCDLSPDDEASWDVPDFAVQIGGSISRVAFERYRIG